MKKGLIAVLAGVLFIVFSAIFMIAADCPEKVTIDEFAKKKAPVTFSHKAHADKFGCKECHHKWDEKGTPEKCSSCHKAKKDGEKPAAKKAYHKKCKGCHKALKKKGEKTGPTKCNDCHKK